MSCRVVSGAAAGPIRLSAFPTVEESCLSILVTSPRATDTTASLCRPLRCASAPRALFLSSPPLCPRDGDSGCSVTLVLPPANPSPPIHAVSPYLCAFRDTTQTTNTLLLPTHPFIHPNCFPSPSLLQLAVSLTLWVGCVHDHGPGNSAIENTFGFVNGFFLFFGWACTLINLSYPVLCPPNLQLC